MSNGNKQPKGSPNKSPAPAPSAAPSSPPASPSSAPAGKPVPKMVVKGPDKPVPGPVPDLFRRWDWITFAITTLVVFCGYFYTLAPQVTLEDSGELAVGSFYAGVPHPPGYPVWTIYTWLFTVLFPFSNIAWRVALSSAVAGAFSCGLVGLLVSRGSSMLMEGIPDLKTVQSKMQHWINLVAGFAAGVLVGFNGFMWSQSVIVEVYPLSVLSLMGVLCFLLRWVYAPHQRKYLYLAAFTFGICLNNHQTLIVATMGLEILILAVQPKLGRDLLIVNTAFYLLGLFAYANGKITSFEGNPVLFGIYNAVGIFSALGAAYLASKTRKILTEWRPLLVLMAGFVIGVMFYFYMPLASMTNPPLNWGYPRTEAGFWHAITRGQYDKTNPSNPFSFHFIQQVMMYVEGAIEEFNFINLLIGLIPFLYYKQMLKRDRAWLVGLASIYAFLAFLLLILLNPNIDRQSKEQARVFFAASHVIIAIAIGYGIAFIGTIIATEYQRIRKLLLGAAVAAALVAFYNLIDLKTQFALDRYNAIFLLVLAGITIIAFALNTVRAPLQIVLVVFALMPLHSVLAHWADNEQRGHYFGYWFGHDMFSPPYGIYPQMEKNTVLFGGTDPGRFNPTYMIFCESFIPPAKRTDPEFDRRDVYLITQNALADSTYLDYIRAHYNRSAQHDPFFFVNFLRSEQEELLGKTNFIARMFLPVDRFFTKLGARIEKRRRAEGVYPPKDNPPPPPPELANDPYDVGAYLSKEIITPTTEDSQKAFADYIQDAQRRLQHDMTRPNEPKQIKPGEDVRIVDNRISVSGQIAVMAINALLTKVIFDQNPTNEFYVEESFPLDWMFPHLTPYGIIMKINRNPVPEMTDEMIHKDHEFWSKYSERLIGDWIKYETPVKDVCDFIDKVYTRRDFKDFRGHPEFVRDDNAQKAFSKLRSAIGGVYFWRVQNSRNVAENQRCLKEAEFAFKQAFAFCPYSPEAVYKYVTLLVNLGRTADAELVVKTCQKFDPDNGAMQALAQNLSDIRKSQPQSAAPTAPAAPAPLQQAEAQFKADPSNLTNAFHLASLYLQLQRSNEAMQVLNALLENTNANSQTILSVAKAYSDLQNTPGLEKAFLRATQVMADSPETWYDLSRVQATLNKPGPALMALKKAVELSNARLTKSSNAFNVAKDALTNQNFAALRANPEFLKIVSH